MELFEAGRAAHFLLSCVGGGGRARKPCTMSQFATKYMETATLINRATPNRAKSKRGEGDALHKVMRCQLMSAQTATTVNRINSVQPRVFNNYINRKPNTNALRVQYTTIKNQHTYTTIQNTAEQ
jgi:hypothetical protein